MQLHLVVLVVAAVLCAVTAGFLFAFAVVVMPGLKRLDDREFVRSFQAIDGVIQDGQPVFGIVVGGSVVSLLAATGVSWSEVDGTGRWLLLVAAVVYLAGAVAPTVAVNLPLNSRIQSYDVEADDAPALAEARREFEARWNAYNVLRTCCATATSALVIVVLARR